MPWRPTTRDRVQDDEQLPHAGDERGLGLSALGSSHVAEDGLVALSDHTCGALVAANERHNLMAALLEPLRDRSTHCARGAGDEDPHVIPLPGRRVRFLRSAAQ